MKYKERNVLLAGMTRPDGTPVLLIGLSSYNVKLLQDGRPLFLTSLDVPNRPADWPKMEIALIAGETDDTILEEIKRRGNVPEEKIFDERVKA